MEFHFLKQELTDRSHSLRDRLRLFNGTITPTILYGSESWTLTQDPQQRLNKIQRQMLRMIVHVPRRPVSTHPTTNTSANSVHRTDASTSAIDDILLEPWQDWIKRATHDATRRMQQYKIDDWAMVYRRKKNGMGTESSQHGGVRMAGASGKLESTP